MSRMVRSVSPTDLAQKAFVRGLSDDADEDTLRRTFSKFGEVVEVHIAKDRETNVPRGFAFITFTSSTDCNKACSAMDGETFHGRVLHVELASHFNKSSGGSRGGFRGSRGRSSFRGGRGRGSPRSPTRDVSYRRGGGTARSSWRGSSGRGDYRNYGSRMSDSFYPGEDRFRSSLDRDPPRDYGRYDSEYRSARPERDYPSVRDYAVYRAREYLAGGDRDYGPPPRERDYPYYSPPRDYLPSDRDYPPPRGRDYPPGGRDYQLSRGDPEFDMPPRRYASSRDYDYPSGNGFYDSRPSRRDYGPPPRDYGSSGRYDSYEGGGRAEYKSRGSFSGRGSRDMDYARGMPQRRFTKEDDHPAGIRRSMRTPDGPPQKKMKIDEPMHRSPRSGDADRRY